MSTIALTVANSCQMELGPALKGTDANIISNLGMIANKMH